MIETALSWTPFQVDERIRPNILRLRTRFVASIKYRIRTETNGGAWCPRSQISRDVYEWLQIDLRELKVVSMVETQGRFGNGQVRLSYSSRLISDLIIFQNK
jgi:hypothetical protein